MQKNAAVAIAILAAALPLSAHCAVAHRHLVAHHRVAAHHVVPSNAGTTPHLVPVAADVSGHFFQMPRHLRRTHLRVARLRTLRHPSIRTRSLSTRSAESRTFAIDSWTAPYFVAYPAPIAGAQPPAGPGASVPTARVNVVSAAEIAATAESSSRAATAYAAPASAFDAPADRHEDAPDVEAVTIIFKDGRPSQQVRNYILTRKTLFVGDDNQRPIPVEQLDMTATIKANEEAGITFQVPGSLQ